MADNDLLVDAGVDYAAGAGTEAEQPAPQSSMADLPGALKDWLGRVGDNISEWGRDAATLVNDFITRRDIVDTAQARSQAFVQNINTFSDGLAAVVRADPTALDTAVGLTVLTAPQIVAQHPYVPDDQRAPLGDQLVGEVARNVVRNGIISWGQRDADTAHETLARYAVLFNDGEQSALRDHIDLLDRARQQDNTASTAQNVVDQDARSADTAHAYLDELVRTDGSTQFPANWVRRVVNDQNVGPNDTATLQAIQQRLLDATINGRPLYTDGSRVADLLRRLQNGDAGTRDILGRVGVDLMPRDAQTLNRLARNSNELARVNGIIGQAERALKGPDGELGNDGKQAMDRFVPRFLSEYRALGPGALDPSSPNFLGQLRGLAGGGDELSRRMAIERRLEEKRRSLEDIFARRDARVEVARERFDIQQKMQGLREEARRRAEAAREENQRRAREERRKERFERENALRQQAVDRAWERLRAESRQRGGGGGHGGGGGSHTVPKVPDVAASFERFRRLGRGQ